MVRQVFLKIDYDRCQVCLPCTAAEACKLRAIVKIDPEEPPFLEMSRCRDCRVCILACPAGAIVDSI